MVASTAHLTAALSAGVTGDTGQTGATGQTGECSPLHRLSRAAPAARTAIAVSWMFLKSDAGSGCQHSASDSLLCLQASPEAPARREPQARQVCSHLSTCSLRQHMPHALQLLCQGCFVKSVLGNGCQRSASDSLLCLQASPATPARREPQARQVCCHLFTCSLRQHMPHALQLLCQGCFVKSVLGNGCQRSASDSLLCLQASPATPARREPQARQVCCHLFTCSLRQHMPHALQLLCQGCFVKSVLGNGCQHSKSDSLLCLQASPATPARREPQARQVCCHLFTCSLGQHLQQALAPATSTLFDVSGCS